MAEYEDLEGFSVVFMMMHGSDDIIAMGMHIASTDYEYSDPSLGHGMIERTIGRADARLEDMYGTALLTGNVYSDIGKKRSWERSFLSTPLREAAWNPSFLLLCA